MKYAKPEVMRLAPAVSAIQGVDHIKGIQVSQDAGTPVTYFSVTPNAYEADE